MFEPQQLIEKLHAMEHGAARLEATAEAIAQADTANEHYWRLYFRYEYLTESNIHGDNFKGLLCFPEYLKIFDEHPELEEDMYHDVMWAFKWLLDNATDFYQISLDEVENYFEEFKKRSQKYGFSLRTYHMKHAKFYLTFNQDLAQIAYANFKHYPRSQNSDCEACELNFDMEFALSQNDIETALRMAQPILEGQKSCAEIPHVTYAHLSNYYLYHDNLEEALYYGILCENIIQNQPEFLKETGQLLELYSVLNIGHGWKLFKYGIENFMRCKNPVMRMTFARGAWRLLEQVAKSTAYAQSNFLSLLPVMKEEQGWSVRALADFFYEIADDITRRMDTRNESDYYMDILKTKLPDSSQIPEISHPDKPAHGLVQKFQSVFVTALPEAVIAPVILREKIKALGSPFEVFSVSTEANVCYASIRAEHLSFDVTLSILPEEEPSESQIEDTRGLDEEALKEVLETPYNVMLVTELSGSGQEAYHIIMKLLSALFPEMLGVVSVTAMKAYSPAWVRFAGEYENAVSPHDVFSLYIGGKPEEDEIHMMTSGLCSLGMRELEVFNATKQNFGYYAAMLDRTAAFCVEYNRLPDEGETITHCYDNDSDYPLTWQTVEKALQHVAPDSLAATIRRDNIIATGVLVTEHLPAPETIEFGNTRRGFYRRMNLVKETFDLFLKAIPECESAIVQIEVELTEEMQEKYEYGVELLWAELNPDSDPLTASLSQTAESVPEHELGEIIEISADILTDWRIKMPETGEIFVPEELYLLQEAGI